MNIDDPKLTAFALNELDEPERSTIGRAVAEDPEAQRVIDETRDLARALKNEFAAEIARNDGFQAVEEEARRFGGRRSLSDIRDDPWFWGIGRPLAVAAVVAIFAVLGVFVVGTYSRRGSIKTASTDYVIEAEQNPASQRVELPAANQIPNPLKADSIRQVQRVVIGEINVDENSELRVIETIDDAYRIERLKRRLSAPVISREPNPRPPAHDYALIFLDRDSHIVASTRFCRAANSQFVLRPLRNAYERNGRFFFGRDAVLPGDWRSDVDYDQYGVEFPDWNESIGYAPGA